MSHDPIMNTQLTTLLFTEMLQRVTRNDVQQILKIGQVRRSFRK
jgi:hypothetical protein